MLPNPNLTQCDRRAHNDLELFCAPEELIQSSNMGYLWPLPLFGTNAETLMNETFLLPCDFFPLLKRQVEECTRIYIRFFLLWNRRCTPRIIVFFNAQKRSVWQDIIWNGARPKIRPALLKGNAGKRVIMHRTAILLSTPIFVTLLVEQIFSWDCQTAVKRRRPRL